MTEETDEHHEYTQDPESHLPDKVPYMKLTVLVCVILCDALGVTFLFPFVAFMVKSFNITSDPDQVGRYAGLIASCFPIAQFFSSIFYGSISDKIGRRPVLMWGLLFNAITLAGFGFAHTLFWAMGMRILTGLMNGNNGVAKSYLAESTRKKYHPQVFSVMGLMWGLGNIIGPFMGGYLSNPTEKEGLKLIFSPNGLFGPNNYPFLLPCLLISAIQAIGFVLGYFFLSEPIKASSLSSYKMEDIAIEESKQDESETIPTDTTEPQDSTKDTSNTNNQSKPHDPQNTLASSEQLSIDGSANNEIQVANAEDTEAIGKISEIALEEVDLRENSSKGISSYKSTAEENVEEESDDKTKNNTMATKLKMILDAQLQQLKIIVTTKAVIVITLIYSLVQFSYIIFDEIWGVWAQTKIEKHGLGFGTTEIGITFFMGGVTLLIIQLFVYPALQKRLGLLWSLRLGTVCAIFHFFFVFYLSYLTPMNIRVDDHAPLSLAASFVPSLQASLVSPLFGTSLTLESIIFYAIVCLGFSVRSLSSCFQYTSIFLLVNFSSPSPAMIGSVNGFVITFACLARGIGPATGGALYSWSLEDKSFPFSTWPFNYQLIPTLLATLMCINLCASFFYPSHLAGDQPGRAEKINEQSTLDHAA